ncbi:TonB-dependent receptor [Saccharicrinis sp. GN24d3]|uniref:TonB-dependent receptor n=1 Tax=Saccharicrinis sp. GN24d3 TaxID=3458416 RepID=UPI004036A0CE
MKKKSNDMGLLCPNVNSKQWKIMKISLIFIIFGMMQVSASTYSQTQKLIFKNQQNTLQQIFSGIEEQTNFTVFFKDDHVNLQKVIDAELNNLNISEVLNIALKDSKLIYKISDKLIVILERDNASSGQQDLTRIIKGKVVDSKGESLPGVNVFVEGTTTGTITNIDGDYELKVDGGAQNLVFSFIGYQTQTIAIGDRMRFDITLIEESIGLDEIVAVGYGVQKKSDLTGAVASVKSDKLSKVSVSNPAEALQGRMVGVSITSIGGSPGAGMDIKIRGASTLNNNAPLVIIDGVPGSMYMLNPADIASMEVLKDGAAAAIYGTEAANGVILITTKKGESGKLTIDFSAKWAQQIQTSELDMANAEQYMQVMNTMYDNNSDESKPAFLSEPYYFDTDWLGAVFRQAPMQEYNVSLKGGTEKNQYYVSAGWLDQDGTIIGTDFQKANLRSKIDFGEDWLKGGINFSYNQTDRDNRALSIRETYEILPIIPIYDDSRESGFGYADTNKGMPANNNPIGTEYFNDNQYTDQYLSVNGYVSIDIVKGLNYKFEAGFNNSNRHSFSHNPAYNINDKEQVFYPTVYEMRSNWREYNINNILSYNKNFGKHSISLMAGYIAKKAESDWMEASITGFKNDYGAELNDDGDPVLVVDEVPAGFLDHGFNTLDAGMDGTKNVGGTRFTYTRASIVGRANYSFDNRYLIQATVRRDGSSKFGPDSRYGTFPSVAVGWRMTEEAFMQDVDLLSNLKLRASYGVLGNENSLSHYQYLPLMSSGTSEFLSYSQGLGESVWTGTIARDLENRKYRWEKTTTINIGVDVGLFNNKLSASLNYYNNETSDMLVNKPIAPSTGLKTPTVNFGEMTNSGFELELNYHNNIGDLKYSLFGALSTTKNEVTKMGYAEESIAGAALNYSEHFAHQTRQGYALGSYWLYQTDGIFQSPEEVNAHVNSEETVIQPGAKPGDIRFKDLDDNGKIDPDDKAFSGVGIPKYNFSFSLDASYKSFDLSVLLHGAGGHKIYNGNRYYYESMRTKRNLFASTLNAWTTENRSTSMPRAVIGDPNQNSRESTRFLEDGDFMRVKNIQLGYTLPGELTQKARIQRARLYVSGQNLFTFTDYSGQDPEIGRSDVWSPGLDTSLYPMSRMFLFGVQMTF